LSDALLGGDDPFEPNQEGKVNLQGARLEGVICNPFVRLREARNYALAFYGIRNGREILRHREVAEFDKLDAHDEGKYRAAVDHLRLSPDRENVEVEYQQALLDFLQDRAIDDALRKRVDDYVGVIDGFVKRNRANRDKLTSLGLAYRTDEQLLLGQLPGYRFDDLNLREADMRKFELKAATFRRSILRDALFGDADLRGADFTDADLSGADLKRAKLDNAVFTRAHMGGTDLTGVILKDWSILTDDQKRSATTSDDKKP
jgi:hypothetical protein